MNLKAQLLYQLHSMNWRLATLRPQPGITVTIYSGRRKCRQVPLSLEVCTYEPQCRRVILSRHPGNQAREAGTQPGTGAKEEVAAAAEAQLEPEHTKQQIHDQARMPQGTKHHRRRRQDQNIASKKVCRQKSLRRGMRSWTKKKKL